ncbi:hypothetical protein BDF21DRAFT_332150 [Thamnidium elegans]|nr:hypothetical protein BDF21DRAFT_332150 [Thamnidium elegans]
MNQIREYTSQDQQRFKQFYITTENEKKHARVLNGLYQSQGTKRTWQAGIVGIFGIHITQWLKTPSLPLPLILIELMLWTAGVGFFWYNWLSRDYKKHVQQSVERISTGLLAIAKTEKSNSWVMENNKGELIGTVALKYENGEGKIGYLTAERKQDCKELVQNAFKFGRANKIRVISKWQERDSKCNFTIRTLTKSIDSYPMHDLFSPTALDHDLTYCSCDYLSHNKLVKLPSSLDQLKHLNHLNISHNRLTHLPSSIYSLCKLTHLDMSFNPFTRVSANLARLIDLNLLDLSSTDIIFIPAELLSLTMTTIRFENCLKLTEELDQTLHHNPPSLLENCARQIIQPILFDLIQGKKKKKSKQQQQQPRFQQLPKHMIHYLSRPKACSTCGGPYFKSFVSRYRIIQRQDESWIPIEYKLCSAHWNNEKDRILTLFSEAPERFLPTTTEPCHLKLVPSSLQ